MDDIFLSQGRSRCKAQKISNLHHFQVEIFYQVVDRQLQELNNHFTEMCKAKHGLRLAWK
ncbi:hypothetical protein HN873_068550 [Arachis hypogaea]